MPQTLPVPVFDGHPVRVQRDKDGTIWFCGTDVAECLGYSNTRDALAAHCRAEGVVKRDTLTAGGRQALTFITEPNVYRLVMRSQLAEAERFERWVFEEVLPQIRRTGRYNAPQRPAAPQTMQVPVEEYIELLRARVAQLQGQAAPVATRTEPAPEKPKRRWRSVTEEELETIRTEWGNTPLLALSKKLGRSRHFVKYHAAKMGLFTPIYFLGTGEGQS
jgi:prophage antirepressor-like protein